MIKIDGNYLEGGGQIVRTALALSTLTGIPFEVNDIRKGRDKPGLKAQHLHSIKALEKLCNAKTEGAELGSTTLTYIPGKIKAKTLSIDIGTAGSITLLLQSLLLPCMFADKKIKLKLKGGTDVSWSPSIDYFIEVIVPHLKKFCEKIEIKLLKRGFYPKGSGEVEIKITPKIHLYDYPNFNCFKDTVKNHVQHYDLLEQHNLMMIRGISHASKDLAKAEVAERQAKAARQALSKLNTSISIRKEYQETLSTGSCITLWAVFSKDKEQTDTFNPIILGADTLGKKGKSSEDIGQESADKLLKEIESKAPVDEHLADNLIPWLIFGGSFKTSSISDHTKTNIYTVEQFIGKAFSLKNCTISNI